MVDWLFCSFNSDYSQQELSDSRFNEKDSRPLIQPLAIGGGFVNPPSSYMTSTRNEHQSETVALTISAIFTFR